MFLNFFFFSGKPWAIFSILFWVLEMKAIKNDKQNSFLFMSFSFFHSKDFPFLFFSTTALVGKCWIILFEISSERLIVCSWNLPKWENIMKRFFLLRRCSRRFLLRSFLLRRSYSGWVGSNPPSSFSSLTSTNVEISR